MKFFTATIIAIVALAAVSIAPPPTAEAASPNTTIVNDVMWDDLSGNEIKAQGGSVLKVGATYYWVGTELNGASIFYQSINMYKSTNLETWTFVKSVFRPGGPNAVAAGASAADLGANRWLGRPDLVKRPDGTFLIVMEVDSQSNGVQGNWVGFATSPTIEGTYTYQGRKALPGNVKSGDHSVFVEGANAYYVYIGDTASPSYTRNTTLNIQKLNAAWTAFDNSATGTVLSQPDTTHEAPFVLKVGAEYHMFVSNKDWWGPTRTDHRKSTTLAGLASAPWAPLQSLPGTPHTFNTQFDFIVTIVGSATTSYLLAGDRYSNFRGATDPNGAEVAFSEGLGRNAWFPLTFAGGIPTVRGWTSVDVAVATGTLTGNRVTNGGFDMYDAQLTPGYWVEESAAGYSPDASLINSGGELDGASGLATNKLTITKATPFQSYVSQEVTSLTAGTTYTVSARVASSGGHTFATMILKQAGQPDIVVNVAPASGYATKSTTFTLAASALGKVTIGFYVNSPGNTWLAVDNVSLK